jgi:hypothetical protein
MPAFVRRITLRSLTAVLQQVRGPPTEQLVPVCQHEEPDLLIMGKDLFERLFALI